MERKKDKLREGRKNCNKRRKLHIAREKYKKKENEVKGSHVCKMESPQ